jgi:hypothetical protein
MLFSPAIFLASSKPEAFQIRDCRSGPIHATDISDATNNTVARMLQPPADCPRWLNKSRGMEAGRPRQQKSRREAGHLSILVPD